MSEIDKSAAGINYAYVLFGNGLEKIVPVSSIPGFFPQNLKDFNNQERIKVWFYGKGDKDDYLYNANILLLGTFNYRAGSSRIQRSSTVRRMLSRQLFPAQELIDNNSDNLTTSNDRSSHIPRRLGPRLGPNVQNPINRDDDVVYLGENISVHKDIWETMLAKNDSRFVKDLAEVIWGREVLKKKCLKAEQANKNAENLSPNSRRTELTPTKYKLLTDCLYDKITAANVTGRVRAARMRRVWQYLSKKIYYLRTHDCK